MNPPLATEADQAALWANLDVVDCIATDHAPHSRDEKEGKNPPPGVPGLETSLPLLLTAVAEGRLTMDRLIGLMHDGPRRAFGLPRQLNTWVDVDLDTRYTIDSRALHTRCGWTPFEGIGVKGRVRRVVLRGETVFEDGQILVRPGFGHVVGPHQ
jgi:carbamoyl-phosphate synthase/aspartate carbamoyltransferase/dihydroorotase